jgi:hypothetical protein
MFISGEKIQELADLTIIFQDQKHEDLWKVQIQNIDCKHVILHPGDRLPEAIFKAKTIFVYTHALPLFFERVFPSLKNPITLISNNSDHGVDDTYRTYIDSEKIIKWYTQNRLIAHPKLFSIPIGIANSQWEHGKQDLFKRFVDREYKKEFLVYKNFDICTNIHERNICNTITQQNGIPLSTKTTIPSYWEMLAKSAFVISPPGGGVDCHRIWEALYLKTIPIVKYDECFSQFKHLPIFFIERWEDVTVSLLRERARSLDVNWDIKELDLDYWKNSIS